MTLFIHIFITTMIPIFALIAVGVVMDRNFKLDVSTLSKLNFYILLPAFVFRSLYEAEFDNSSLEIVLCGILILFLNSLLASVICRFTGYDKNKTEIFRNATMFNNCGNIGIAVASFVFSNTPYLVNGQAPYLHTALVSVVALLIIQNISSNTLGFYQAGIGRMTARDCIALVFHMPTIYIVPAALLFKLVPYDLTTFFLWPALNYFASAFVAIAMITLGIQVSRTPLNFLQKDVLLATFTRIVLGPAVAALAIIAFIHLYSPFQPISAQTIMITYSVPSAINTALIAMEMHNNPGFATQIVMSTTLFSAVTMPIAIMAAYYLFPV